MQTRVVKLAAYRYLACRDYWVNNIEAQRQLGEGYNSGSICDSTKGHRRATCDPKICMVDMFVMSPLHGGTGKMCANLASTQRT